MRDAAAWTLLSLAACGPDTRFIAPGSGVEVYAWIVLDANGQLEDSSPLQRVGAEALALPPDGEVVFLGWGAPLLPEVGAGRLAQVERCEPQLVPPTWASDSHGRSPAALPPLASPRLAERCTNTVGALVCFPCDNFAALPHHVGELDLSGNATGVAQRQRNGVWVVAPPNELKLFTFSEEGGISASPIKVGEMLPIGQALGRDVVFLNFFVYVATASGAVVRANPLGARTDIQIGPGDLRLVASTVDPVFAFSRGGSAWTVASTAAVARQLNYPPIINLARRGGETLLLTERALLFIGTTTTTTIALPPGFPPLDDTAVAASARVGFIGGDVVLAAQGTNIHRRGLRAGTWEQQSWPEAAELRAFAELADTLLAAGKADGTGGLIRAYNDRGQWETRVRSPINALAGGRDRERAYAVSSGTPPLLVEIPLP